MGKGGGGGPTQSTSTTNTSNIPEYAKPYVENMLGATQKQLFQTTPTTDASGNTINEITGFRPYQAYGGTYDAQGNQISYDPSKAVAGFSPLQQQAQAGAAGLQMPGEYGAAAGLTGMGIAGAMGAGRNYQRMATSPYAMQAYMNPYVSASLQPQLAEIQRQADITGQNLQGQAVRQGAFGGNRAALQQAENQRNALMAQQQAIGQGYNTAFQQAQQAQQFGANLGLQGYGQAMQGAGQLAGIGSQALQAQQGIIGLQNQMGQQQQAQQQQIINQAMTDYANAQQYPLMQLGFMSNMLRGLPMQATTTNQYQAAPNPYMQGLGVAGAGASLYNAMKSRTGGIIKEKNMAKGGIASVPGYKSGVLISLENKLDDISEADPKALAKLAGTTTSPELKRIIEQKRLEDAAGRQMAGISAAPTGNMATNMAGGGIVAFADNEDQPVSPDMPPTTTQAAPPPAVAVPPAPPVASPYSATPGQMDPLFAQKIAQNIAARKQILGLPDVGEKQAKVMKSLEQEEAGAAKETERLKSLAAVPAFAELAKPGHPGERLAAALTTGAAGMTSVLESAKKARRENLLAQANLEKGIREEKRGDFDAAEKSYTHAEDRASREKIARMEVAAKLAAAKITSAPHPSVTEREYNLWKTDPEGYKQFVAAKSVADNAKIADISLKAQALAKESVGAGGPLRPEYSALLEQDKKAGTNTAKIFLDKLTDDIRDKALKDSGLLPTNPAAGGGSKPSSGGVPKKGDVVDGYKFNGGDPADKNNWEKQ